VFIIIRHRKVTIKMDSLYITAQNETKHGKFSGSNNLT